MDDTVQYTVELAFGYSSMEIHGLDGTLAFDVTSPAT
jgi:hypothetical protein